MLKYCIRGQQCLTPPNDHTRSVSTLYRGTLVSTDTLEQTAVFYGTSQLQACTTTRRGHHTNHSLLTEKLAVDRIEHTSYACTRYSAEYIPRNLLHLNTMSTCRQANDLQFRDTAALLSAPYLGRHNETGTKVELEALYTLGMDALTGRFLETAVLREDHI